MIELIEVAVENELDLSLAYRKSMKAGELAKISVSLRTAFATAISEVCREIIDKGLNGRLNIAIEVEGPSAYNLVAILQYKVVIPLNESSEGFIYAAKLLPVFEHHVSEGVGKILLKLKVPRTVGLNRGHITRIKQYFDEIEPLTPYENLRKQNKALFKTNEQSTEALRTAEYIIAQKNEFLSVASHELKTPITILRAFTQLAVKKGNSEDIVTQLEKIDAQARKIQDMISQLLDISKSEYDQMDYRFEVVDVNAYIAQLEELLKSLVPKHQFVFHGVDQRYLVNIDRLRMEQVVNNLVGNAAKYSHAGSTIKLALEYLREDSAILLSVEDSGIGMEQCDLQKVFDKFYRVTSISKKISGLGVGLYISSKIVYDHGGEIWAKSGLGKGSTFYVKIPINTVIAHGND